MSHSFNLLTLKHNTAGSFENKFVGEIYKHLPILVWVMRAVLILPARVKTQLQQVT